MKLEYFKEHNVVFAKGQPQYIPLPAHRFPNDEQGMIAFCWGLGFWERVWILFSGKIWHQVLTFNRPLQPQMLSAQKPNFGDGENGKR